MYERNTSQPEKEEIRALAKTWARLEMTPLRGSQAEKANTI